MKKIKVGVVGATGYTGEELLRILVRHPHIEVTYVSGKEDRAEKIQDVFPYLQGKLDLECNAFSVDEVIKKTDLVFLSLPHTISMDVVPQLLKAGKKVIDVSADYRLQDEKAYEKFYKVSHKDLQNLKHAVYGIPELNRAKIKSAKLIANPGCYPTGSILGLVPGLKAGVFAVDTIQIDAKSGVTGAGRKADKGLQFSEVNESVKAYKLFEHQHVPEIDQALTSVAGKEVSVVFVPHLVPINRGILSTIYVKLTPTGASGLKKKLDTEGLLAIYKKFYTNEPFVKVYDAGRLPEVKYVTNTNLCHIGLKVNEEKGLAVIVTAIDNLGKGAAGQAVQNMNILCGFDETEGL
ncbi:N-acetyl-gamma-glutamyl-phosphate reductase [Candidatus Kaiserbacteria bacterium RIFCSPLOWO2_12_FULL_53_8]|uniref:N-acetyl-gamma-glutamyl-phosphate reductase n=2 Tax=Candidatus Kaiseribacteriota TaxID=1752734 RepID=A0A1F6CVU3_9BACT|nr:MAG: N-acetyl-gamma-glutamyl-phosphate reductase [Candidatus Kaiserbacteria bacterium RIFCSPHIGHO2_01_FULL_53_29]OGG91727.1 MAG: N-acetyl-gamma-glutamyl-phosphate reductase [Candidatus Kaiserbacteria bacterium RIFCSPLOWO2_12_FULL_53_8]